MGEAGGGAEGEFQENNIPYAVKITIPEDSKTAEFYYFCHIHSGMSGLMVVEDPPADANALVTPLAADYYGPAPEEFDVACGTYDNVTEFHVDKDTYCPGMTFPVRPTGTPFSQCMEAIDCKMNYEMRVQEKEANKLAVFMEQMIPHHWNAILMSRIALKQATDADGFDDEDLNVPPHEEHHQRPNAADPRDAGLAGEVLRAHCGLPGQVGADTLLACFVPFVFDLILTRF